MCERDVKCINPFFYRYTYIVNIFGGIKDGPEGCPKTSAVCRKSKLGDEVLALAPISSQKVSGKFSGGFFIHYIFSYRQERLPPVSADLMLPHMHHGGTQSLD